jgi:hypothetical protein
MVDEVRSNLWGFNFILWNVFVIFVLAFFAYWGMDKLDLKDLEPLLGILQNTSSMVFAIAGIWIAYLYPEAIASIIKDGKSTVYNGSNDDVSRVRLIVGVIALSGLVMGCLIIFSMAVPLFQKSSFYLDEPNFFRGIGLMFIFSLAYIQLFAVYVILASNINFLIRLTNMQVEDRLDKKLNPLKSVKKDSNN